MIGTIASVILNNKKKVLAISLLAFFGSKTLLANETLNNTQNNQLECNVMMSEASQAKEIYQNLDFKNEDLNKALEIYGYDKIITKIQNLLGNNCSLDE